MGKTSENRKDAVDDHDAMTIMCWKDQLGHVVELLAASSPRRRTPRFAHPIAEEPACVLPTARVAS